MELKVWVEGLERVVCGLTESTTCQEIIYALAHATGKTGRFVLVEEVDGRERSLAPNERPLERIRRSETELRHILRCLDQLDDGARRPPVPQRSTEALNTVRAEGAYPGGTHFFVANGGAYAGGTGSLPRIRHHQRPPLHKPPANYQTARVPVAPDSGLSAGASSASVGDPPNAALRHPIATRKGPASGRSASSGSGVRRPPPPSYQETLTRLQAQGRRPPASPASTASSPPAPSPSIDSPTGGSGYQFPASRQQLIAMIQHHERQLRAQGARMKQCDEQLEKLTAGSEPDEEQAEAELARLEEELEATRAALIPLRAENLDQGLNFARKAEEELRHQCDERKAKTAEVEARLAELTVELASLEQELASESEESPSTASEKDSGSGPSEGDLKEITDEVAQVDATLRERQGILDALIRTLGSHSNSSLDSSRDSNKPLETADVGQDDSSGGKRPGVWV